MVDLASHDEDMKNIESGGFLETDNGVSERAFNRGLKALETSALGIIFLSYRLSSR